MYIHVQYVPFLVVPKYLVTFSNLQHILDEHLIKWGWPEDVWFHVDKLSSAHVYLRLNEVSR